MDTFLSIHDESGRSRWSAALAARGHALLAPGAPIPALALAVVDAAGLPQARAAGAGWVLAVAADAPEALALLLAGAHDACAGATAAELELRLIVAERALARNGLRAQSVTPEQMQVAERLAAVGTLAAGVAHEINNPLAYVVANLAYLGEELARPAAAAAFEQLPVLREALAEAQEGAQRVRAIVHDLKTFSRTDEEHLAAVDVREVLESTLHLAANEIRHRATLVRELGPVPPVEANPGRLAQVFMNLLVNAAQALPEDGRAHQVRVVTRTEGQAAVVEVHDTGVGISAEVRARIFDPFFTTKPVGVGTGLGLSICHGIVRRLGGELQVESEPGQGSCFRVVLPGLNLARPRSIKPPLGPTEGQRGRILVIDDEPMVCASIRRALASQHEVVAVPGGPEALAALAAGPPFDLLLCDLLMPGMTGMDLHAQLQRERPELLSKMVFLSGGAFTGRAQAFLDEPDRAFLEKPFDVDVLRALVREKLAGAAKPRG